MADIRMPQLGESVTEGTLGKWLKQVGDKVAKYEPLVEVITDKVNAEIPSDVEGILTEIIVQEGETVVVGTVIGVISDAQEALNGTGDQVSPSVATNQPNTIAQAPVEATQPISTSKQASVLQSNPVSRYSPAVMRLLQEHQLDPAQIRGTGLGGRITRKDVLSFIESGAPTTVAPVQVQQVQVEHAKPVQPSDSIVAGQTAQASISQGAAQQKPITHAEDTVLPLTPVRRTIARRMLESKHQAPHAWTMVEVDVTSLVKYRTKVKESFKQSEGVDLTYLPFFIKAVSESLKEFPILNSTWAEDSIIVKKAINISIAIATDDALVVPVIHHADRMSITGIAHAVHDIVTKAKSGKLTIEDMQGGTFTVNNTGAFGSILSAPIINSPQAAILSMESIVKRPVVLDNDAIAIRSMVNLCLSLDHRVLDGLVCGRFLQSVKRRLQEYGDHTIL